MKAVRVGVIGCGAISGAYLGMARSFPIVEIAACADLDEARAKEVAERFGVRRACSVDELIDADDLDVVLNLTIPNAHAQIGLRAINAGKHLYVEKPLGINRDEGAAVLEAAGRKGVRIGCAPDTFMGAGIQTARKVIDDGRIGKPIAFTAFMMGGGHESWHPNPGFYYQPGGGPMFDMGPYYLTALLNFFGPIARVSGAASIAIPERTITSQPNCGQTIHVTTPDHICGLIEFAEGAVGTIITSFATRFPSYEGSQPITVFGTEGTMRVPDPNHFDGSVHVRRTADADWSEVAPAFTQGYGRGIGLADMAMAIRTGGPFRADGQQAFAVLDAMQGFLDAAALGQSITMQPGYRRPAAMPLMSPGNFD